MTDLEVHEVLNRATAEVSAPADLLDRVTAGGRRRVIRRRALLTAGLAVAGAGATAGVLRLGGGSGVTPPANDRLDAPTRGDLATDAAFLDAAINAWRAALPASVRTVGEPNVAWAGTTPAGRLALVAQRIPLDDPPGGPVHYGVTGFVELRDGASQWTVGGPETMVTGWDNANAFLVGEAVDPAFQKFAKQWRDAPRSPRTLIVVDDGRPTRFASRYTVDRAGRIVWSFEEVVFRDGSATRPISDPASFALVAGGRRVELGNPKGSLPLDEMPSAREVGLGGSGDERRDVRNIPGYEDMSGYHDPSLTTAWRIAGVTPDNRAFVLQTVVDDKTIRLFRFLDGEQPEFLGVVPERRQSAFATRLPDGQGIVFASKRSRFRYRRLNGGWITNPDAAALLPPDTLEIRYQDGANEALLPVPT